MIDVTLEMTTAAMQTRNKNWQPAGALAKTPV
jgi:hypothetical protein